MEVTVVVTLMVMGIVLMLIEIFLLPGISIAGVAGVLFMIGSVYYAYEALGSSAGHITLLSGIILMIVAVWIFIKSKALDKMSLKTEIKSKNDPLEDLDIKVGDEGITVSRLAPMGKVKINGKVVEAKSLGDFIDQDSIVTVIQVLRTNVIVELNNN